MNLLANNCVVLFRVFVNVESDSLGCKYKDVFVSLPVKRGRTYGRVSTQVKNLKVS